ncbi:MAG: hypothetical protein H0W24_07240 [Lysobacter sp.]|nr:hypothetical protein [Lysobacter sp.]
MFLIECGDMTPLMGCVDAPTGYGVYRIDPGNRRVEPFVRTSAVARGPKGLEYIATAGLTRLVDVAFPSVGQHHVHRRHPRVRSAADRRPMRTPMEATGVVWRVYRTGSQPEGPPAGIRMPPGSARTTAGGR